MIILQQIYNVLDPAAKTFFHLNNDELVLGELAKLAAEADVRGTGGMWASRLVAMSELEWHGHPDNPTNASRTLPAVTDPPQIWDMPNGDVVIVRDTCVSLDDATKPGRDGDLWVCVVAPNVGPNPISKPMWLRDVFKGELRPPAEVQEGQVYVLWNGETAIVREVKRYGKRFLVGGPACMVRCDVTPVGADPTTYYQRTLDSTLLLAVGKRRTESQ